MSRDILVIFPKLVGRKLKCLFLKEKPSESLCALVQVMMPYASMLNYMKLPVVSAGRSELTGPLAQTNTLDPGQMNSVVFLILQLLKGN